MNRHSGKWALPPDGNTDSGHDAIQPRRVGQIVHDDRGAASVEWRNAPANYERPVFEIEDRGRSGRDDSKLRRGFEPKLEVKREVADTFNPYDRKPDPVGGRPDAVAPKGGKRDLKKLSEWLQLMRAMEERKKNDAD